MRKSLKGAVAALCILAVCLSPLSTAVYAAGVTGVPVDVAVSIEGTPPEQAEEYSIVLKADDPSFPMPQGSAGGEYTVTITGEGEAEIPAINYERAGVYTYTISQTAGADETCDYDDTVYYLTVFVTNREDGDGLETSSVLHTGDKNDKHDSASFTNTYPVLTDITVRKVWDAEGEKTPESVAVTLMRNGETYEKVILSEENNWTYTWKRLPASEKWTVEETDVPEGYRATYSADGNIITITNTAVSDGDTPQTGDTSNAALYTATLIAGVCGVCAAVAPMSSRRRTRDDGK